MGETEQLKGKAKGRSTIHEDMYDPSPCILLVESFCYAVCYLMSLAMGNKKNSIFMISLPSISPPPGSRLPALSPKLRLVHVTTWPCPYLCSLMTLWGQAGQMTKNGPGYIGFGPSRRTRTHAQTSCHVSMPDSELSVSTCVSFSWMTFSRVTHRDAKLTLEKQFP